MILATVYIVTYKRFDSIYKTIDSALNQDYSNIELFVSDDGSLNFPYKNIVDYVETNKKKNIVSYHVLDNKENVGTVKHINKILKQANGDLYIPLAGDDSFFDNSVVRRIVEKYEQTHFDILATSRALFKVEGKYISLMPHYGSRIVIERRMATASQQYKAFTEDKKRNFASGSALAYKSSFIKEMGFFDEKYILWEDGPFLHKILSKGVAVTLGYDIISIKYRWGGVSVSINPLMQRDINLFNASDLWKNANRFGWYHKRILRYTQLKFMIVPVWKRLLIKVLFADVVFGQILYKLEEQWLGRNDVKIINELIR